MDKNLIVFIVIGAGFLYFITNFVGDLQQEDDRYKNREYQQAHQFDQYKSVDSIGREILDLTGADAKTQISAWNKSKLKKEFIELFPDFAELKRFVKERTRGDILQAKLLKTIDHAESEYFAGRASAEDAKRMLSTLK
ncbi:MAG: hypothetical protein P794_01530 [Epsilonproteobacteria bacterium (ex Lamellibrachia satsuma)]|nr:MAG: hypothetical protein P794_01530 [Epsilonproteobacteria bacterium (ex Lamellibrachia satsuma)]